MRLTSMRARVTAIFAMMVTTLMVISGLLVRQHELQLAEDREKQTLTVAIDRAASEIEESPEETLLEIVRNNQGEIGARGLVMFVTDSSGHLLWSSREVNFPVDPEQWRTKSLTLGPEKLILASDFRPNEERARETTLFLILIGFFMLVTTSISAWFLVGKTLLPIQKLASQAQALTDTRSVRLETPSSDAEMQHLTATFNELLGRLQRNAEARGRFYAAASHELRTPLQALLGHLDVALSRKRSADNYKSALLEAQKHTERLTTLVQDLLQLNALEMKATILSRESLDLVRSVVDTLQLIEKLAVERDVKIEKKFAEVEVEAPIVHLEMLLRNLLENSIKYAKSATTVVVTVEQRQGGAMFCVWNACDNSLQIDSGQDLSAWFEPFFRLDASRNSQTGGNGLGLAICESIARANNWKITLESKDGGVLASVLFPVPILSESASNPLISQQIP